MASLSTAVRSPTMAFPLPFLASLTENPGSRNPFPGASFFLPDQTRSKMSPTSDSSSAVEVW